MSSPRKLVAALACRNNGSRLYGKPVQNLDINKGIRIIDNIIDCLKSIESIDEIVLGIAQGAENEIFKTIADQKGIRYLVGDENDVLSRLIQCGQLAAATDIFRVTSESPFLYFDQVEMLWEQHKSQQADATLMDYVIDGCGFEIITLQALQKSHINGESKHRSEYCTLYIRENYLDFKIIKAKPPQALIRNDLRLTVDNPEDLVVCRAVYEKFKESAPQIPVLEIVAFLDKNPKLIELTAPFAEEGYAKMYL